MSNRTLVVDDAADPGTARFLCVPASAGVLIDAPPVTDGAVVIRADYVWLTYTQIIVCRPSVAPGFIAALDAWIETQT